MKRLLTAEGRLALREHVRPGTLMAFDFDGTLAPIRADPHVVGLRLSTHCLLRDVAERFPCIVISGRAREDVRSRLANLPLREVLGNHGIEPWYASRIHVDCIQHWRELLTAELGALRGVRIEDKVYSLSIHFRQAEDPQRSQHAIQIALAKLERARIVPGKKLFNVMPVHAAHKGIALTAALERFGCERALYVGDDHTDDDVFASCDPHRVFGVRVGFSRSSQAAYHLSSQGEIDSLLEAVLRS